MAKKKKHNTSGNTAKSAASYAQQEHCYHVVKKILRHFEMEPELIDIFSKKQKQLLLAVWFDSLVVRPKVEKSVPRQYVRNLQTEIHRLIRTNCWGNPENRLIYNDVMVYGLSFIMNITTCYKKGVFAPGTLQCETAKRICEKFNLDELMNDVFKEVLLNVSFKAKCYSRINFRVYGYDSGIDNIQRPAGLYMKPVIYLTAQDNTSKKFIHNDIERRAFAVFRYDNGKLVHATVKRKMLFPLAKEDEELNVYVQSHVLHRLKERLDAFGAEIRNMLIQYAFTNGLQVELMGKQVLFASLIEDDVRVGYFTFFISDNNVVINTLIPIASANTPEGQKLHELLPLGKEDMIYLGMDRISFYLHIDFEQIPVLKQALIDSNIWETKLKLNEMYSRDENKKSPIDANKTLFVKNFFDKLENNSAFDKQTDEILRQL